MDYWRLDEEFPDPRRPDLPDRRRPLLVLVAVVAAASAVGVAGTFHPLLPLFLAIPLLLLALAFLRRPASSWLLLAVLALLSAAHARQETAVDAPTSLATLLRRPSEYAAFTCVLLEDSVLRPASYGRPPAAIFRARLEALDRDGAWRPASGTVRVCLQDPAPVAPLPLYGERWLFRGILTAARPVENGLFTLRRDEAVVAPDRARRLAPAGGNPLVRWCMARRRACAAVLSRGLPPTRGAAILRALLLGYREDIPDALRADFSSTGSIHIFAISGAHVAIVALFLDILLRLLHIPRHRCFPFVAAALALYVLMTGAAVSAVRAAVMLSSAYLAPALRRRPDSLSALSLAALLILIVSPAQVADIGFLLSFSAVWGILAVHPLLERLVLARVPPDPWSPPRPVPFFFHLPALVRWFVGSALLGASVWFVTMPLTLRLFHLFSPIALLVNPFVIPAAFAILLSGVLSLLAAPLPLPLSDTFNAAGSAVAEALARLVETAAAVPYGHLFLPPPPLYLVILWFAAIALAARAIRRRLPHAWPLSALALLLLAAAWAVPTARRTTLDLLDAGSGQSLFLRTPSASVLLDAGPAYRAHRTLRQLRALGANRLDVLLLSHPDSDHVGAASEILSVHPAREIWLPAVRWRTPAFEAWLSAQAAAGTTLRHLSAGDIGTFPPDVHWEVLWPPAGLAPLRCADDASLLLRLSRGTNAVLVASDFGTPQEAAYLALHRAAPLDHPLPAASSLVVGRHGDATATTPDFLSAVRPSAAYLSCAPDTRKRLPDPALLDLLSTNSVPLHLSPAPIPF